MSNYIAQQIAHCIEKIDENANQKGQAAISQWHYWQGALKAYQNMAECAEELAVTTE